MDIKQTNLIRLKTNKHTFWSQRALFPTCFCTKLAHIQDLCIIMALNVTQKVTHASKPFFSLDPRSPRWNSRICAIKLKIKIKIIKFYDADVCTRYIITQKSFCSENYDGHFAIKLMIKMPKVKTVPARIIIR